jgi:serine/threonine-protein kinase
MKTADADPRLRTPTAPPDPENLVFGKYEVIERLAQGGMGEVFLARFTGLVGLNRLVILKRLLPQLAAQDEFVEQFLDEARVTASLNHPNVVTVYEVGAWKGDYYIALEFINGADITKLLKRAAEKKVPVPFSVTAKIIRDAAEGLAYAHAATDSEGQLLNVIHRDISPQNIMVTEQGRVKVVDFGIAKSEARMTRTETGVMKGKLQYMAPEQIRAENLDSRSDQFGLGVVFWELLAGRRLFKAVSELEVMKAILTGKVLPPSRYSPHIPATLDRIVMRMLGKESTDRFESMRQVVEELQVFLLEETGATGEEEVARFVDSLIGEEIQERTQQRRNTPGDFLISLRPEGSEDATTVLPGGPDAAPSSPSTQADTVAHQTPLAIEKAGDMDQDPADPGHGRSRTSVWILGSLVFLGMIFLGVFVVTSGDDNPISDPPAVEATPKKSGVSYRVEGASIQISEPTESVLFVDDEKQNNRTPARYGPLSPGEHVLVLKSPGGKTFQWTIHIKAQPAQLTIGTEPAGATVYINGKSSGQTPLELKNMPAGKDIAMRVVKAGFEDSTFELALKPNETRMVQLNLKKVGKKRSPRKSRGPKTEKQPVQKESAQEGGEGFFTLNTKPWAQVTIDGVPRGTTPLYRLPLKAGKHVVSIENSSKGIKTKRTILIEKGKTKKVTLDLRNQGPSSAP